MLFAWIENEIDEMTESNCYFENLPDFDNILSCGGRLMSILDSPIANSLLSGGNQSLVSQMTEKLLNQILKFQ